VAEHARRYPLHQRRPVGTPDSWENPRQERDDWEERPREIAFWAVPLLLTMLAMAIIILYFSFVS